MMKGNVFAELHSGSYRDQVSGISLCHAIGRHGEFHRFCFVRAAATFYEKGLGCLLAFNGLLRCFGFLFGDVVCNLIDFVIAGLFSDDIDVDRLDERGKLVL